MNKFTFFTVLSCFVVIAGSSRTDYRTHVHTLSDREDTIVGERICVDYAANHIPYHEIIYSKALKYKVEPLLVHAMIQVESSGRTGAVSQKGAKGLMQLMPATARQMNVKNPFNPEENIEGGVKYLRYLLDRFNGDVAFALAAYNAGPTRIERFGGIPPIRETQQYVRRVLSIYIENNMQQVAEVDEVYM